MSWPYIKECLTRSFNSVRHHITTIAISKLLLQSCYSNQVGAKLSMVHMMLFPGRLLTMTHFFVSFTRCIGALSHKVSKFKDADCFIHLCVLGILGSLNVVCIKSNRFPPNRPIIDCMLGSWKFHVMQHPSVHICGGLRFPRT